MKRLRAVAIGLLLLVPVGVKADADGCDVLHVLGFPMQCEVACRYGWNSAFSNQACLFEILINAT